MKNAHKSTAPDVTLQPVTAKDWDLLAEMEKNAACEMYIPYTTESEIKNYTEHSKVFFVMRGEEKIGSISYQIKDDNSVYFDGMTVVPEHRHQGVATAAMKAALEDLTDHQDLNLLVHPRNTAALMVYLKSGFTIKEWRDNAFGDGQPRLFLVKTNK